MGLFRRRPKADRTVSPDDRSPQLGIKYKDLELMGQLMHAGARLSEPRHVLYYSYAPNREVAETMALESRARGFEVTVDEPLEQYPDQWLVRAEIHTALHPEFVRETTDFFEDLAFRHEGAYDGWEAAVS